MSRAVDVRSAADFEALLHERVPGYLPGWSAEPGGPGSALLAIAGRLSAVVADRLNRAPEKNQLAFLDMLGVSLLPAQPARAPVMFALRAGMSDTRAPAGTQVGASVSGVDGPLIFETERDIALAVAPLVEIATVLPGADQWASHTSDFGSRRPFTLFGAPQPVAHELYLAHDVHFALQGHCEVHVQLELAAAARRSISMVWEYWDGDGWRAFGAFKPGTAAGDNDSIDGTRGLTRSGTVVLRVDGASAKRRIVNWIDSYWIRARSADPLTPDYAGTLPRIDRVLVASVVAPPIGSLTVIEDDKPIPRDWSTTLPMTIYASEPLPYSADPSSAVLTITEVDVADEDEAYSDTRSLAGGYTQLDVPVGEYEFRVSIAGFTTVASSLKITSTTEPSTTVVRYTLNEHRPEKGSAGDLPLDLTKPFYPFGASAQAGAVCYLMLSDALSKPGAKVTMAFERAFTGLEPSGGNSVAKTVDVQYFDGERWKQLDAVDASGGAADVASLFTSTATLQFDVPSDCTPRKVAEISGYWIRFRIASGTFGVYRNVTIVTDPKAKPPKTTSFTLRELISPVVGAVRYSYFYRSEKVAPTGCHTCNDFAWVDHSRTVATRGTPFAPFTLVEDPTPALYFGFDAPLPEDILGIYLAVQETAAEESGPALVWECLDTDTWVPMSVEDETAGMTLPGAVRIAYPG